MSEELEGQMELFEVRAWGRQQPILTMDGADQEIQDMYADEQQAPDGHRKNCHCLQCYEPSIVTFLKADHDRGAHQRRVNSHCPRCRHADPA